MIEVYGYSIATLPAIVAIVYGIIEFLKHFVFVDNETFKKYIPVISTVLGGVIGVVTFFVCPESIPVGTWYAAIFMGCASGLSAVGVNQITKQIKKGGDNGGS
jgi:multidrug transporter EmrE-like cation transporter